jgi:hypothetical protein
VPGQGIVRPDTVLTVNRHDQGNLGRHPIQTALRPQPVP